MSGVLTRVFASDFDAALEQCRAWLADPELQAHVPEAWAKAFSWSHGSGVRDPGEVLAALPELNGAVDAEVLSTWTKADPEAAAGWIAERLEQGGKVPMRGSYGERGILTELATARPEFTASWLLGLPEGEFRIQAADTLIANWAAFDPVAAGGWIEALPEGPLREGAERGLERVSARR